MDCRYLLDTNIASYVIKGNAPAVRRRLVRHAISEIAVYPANLCSFSGHIEFSGFSDDFDESVGEAAENSAR